LSPPGSLLAPKISFEQKLTKDTKGNLSRWPGYLLRKAGKQEGIARDFPLSLAIHETCAPSAQRHSQDLIRRFGSLESGNADFKFRRGPRASSAAVALRRPQKLRADHQVTATAAQPISTRAQTTRMPPQPPSTAWAVSRHRQRTSVLSLA